MRRDVRRSRRRSHRRLSHPLCQGRSGTVDLDEDEASNSSSPTGRGVRPRAAVTSRLRDPRSSDLSHRRPQGDEGVDDPPGCHGARAAGEIHTDFQKHFIKAEVSPSTTSCHSVRCPGEGRGQGAYRGQGILMRDGDVVEFRVGV